MQPGESLLRLSADTASFQAWLNTNATCPDATSRPVAGIDRQSGFDSNQSDHKEKKVRTSASSAHEPHIKHNDSLNLYRFKYSKIEPLMQKMHALEQRI